MRLADPDRSLPRGSHVQVDHKKKQILLTTPAVHPEAKALDRLGPKIFTFDAIFGENDTVRFQAGKFFPSPSLLIGNELSKGRGL